MRATLQKNIYQEHHFPTKAKKRIYHSQITHQIKCVRILSDEGNDNNKPEI